MPLSKFHSRFILMLCAWLPAQTSAFAAAPTNSIPMQASITPENVPNLETYYRAYIDSKAAKFSFILPRTYRTDSLTSADMQLVNENYNRFLSFRILGPLSADAKKLDATDFRELLLDRHPGAKILEEFSLHAASHTGPAFDLEWAEANGVVRRSRVAFIPSAAGVLEFSLVCGVEQFSQAKNDLNSMMLTFRTGDSNGHLEISRLSDKI